jgi:hypothetical protein
MERPAKTSGDAKACVCFSWQAGTLPQDFVRTFGAGNHLIGRAIKADKYTRQLDFRDFGA